MTMPTIRELMTKYKGAWSRDPRAPARMSRRERTPPLRKKTHIDESCLHCADAICDSCDASHVRDKYAYQVIDGGLK